MEIVCREFPFASMPFSCYIIIGKCVNGETKFYFKANEITDFLEYKNPWQAVLFHVPENWKTSLESLMNDYNAEDSFNVPVTWRKDTIFLTEHGLYSLVTRSKTTEAVKFVEWITEEILPSLRSSDSQLSTTVETEKDEWNRKLEIADQKNIHLQNELDTANENVTIFKNQMIIGNELTQQAHKNTERIIGIAEQMMNRLFPPKNVEVNNAPPVEISSENFNNDELDPAAEMEFEITPESLNSNTTGEVETENSNSTNDDDNINVQSNSFDIDMGSSANKELISSTSRKLKKPTRLAVYKIDRNKFAFIQRHSRTFNKGIKNLKKKYPFAEEIYRNSQLPPNVNVLNNIKANLKEQRVLHKAKYAILTIATGTGDDFNLVDSLNEIISRCK